MNRKGFTLLELIVVLIVLAALVAIALPQYTGFVERARAAEAINALGAIKTGEEAVRLNSTNYIACTSANINANLGLTLAQTDWTYAVAANGAISFTATATRVGGPNPGSLITMTYTAAGVTTWPQVAPVHPGSPR